MPSGDSGGGGGAVVGGGAAGGRGAGLGAAPHHARDPARFAGAAGEALEREQAAAEAVAEAGGHGGELKGDGRVGGMIDGVREGSIGTTRQPHGQVVDGAELQDEEAREEGVVAVLGDGS